MTGYCAIYCLSALKSVCCRIKKQYMFCNFISLKGNRVFREACQVSRLCFGF